MQELNRQPIIQGQPLRQIPKVVNTKEKHKYIFPNPLAKMMKNVPMNVQLESSMMASGLILIGMVLMAIFLVFFTSQTIAFKVLTLINLVGAFIFISSAMVTTFQQYVSYMDVIDIQRTMGMQDLMGSNLPINDLNMNRPKNKKNQFLFFGGLLVILIAFTLSYWLWDVAPSLEEYSIWITIGISLIGALMIFLVFKKQKPKKIIKRIIKKPVQEPIRQPIQQPPRERPNLAFREPPKQEIQQSRPIPQRPAQSEILVARPIPQRPIPQRPIPPRPMVEDRSVRREPVILKKNKPNREEKMLSSIEKTLNERLYEINRLKAQQR